MGDGQKSVARGREDWFNQLAEVRFLLKGRYRFDFFFWNGKSRKLRVFKCLTTAPWGFRSLRPTSPSAQGTGNSTMPKMKSHRGAAKRFNKTATGKIKTGRSNHSHILTKKSTKRKRGLRGTTIASDADTPRLTRLIPYK